VTRNSVVISAPDQRVLFVREGLYRLCELSLNQDLTPDLLLKLYEVFFSTAAAMDGNAVKAEESKARIANAEARKALVSRDCGRRCST
jgi:hypothetical protein